MKYLITGGAGFIGSHLVHRLLKDEDNYVVVIDDFSEGKWENLPEYEERLAVCRGSILADDSHFYYKDVDTVFHLAAYTRPQMSIENPMRTNHVNIQGTLRVLEHARDSGVRRVVFTSTSSVYGDQKKLPTKETAQPNLMSPYALSKLAGEDYCRLFRDLHDLEFNIIRPFNVYGPRQNPEGGYAAAVPAFVNLLKQGKTPWITGDGKQARDYIYVGDLVDLMIRASESKVTGEVFNGGSGKNVSINRLYEIIAGILGTNIKPNYVDKVFEPRKTLADVGKAKRLLGWKPATKLRKGLIQTIKET